MYALKNKIMNEEFCPVHIAHLNPSMKNNNDYLSVTAVAERHSFQKLSIPVNEDESLQWLQFMHFTQLSAEEFTSKMEESLNDRELADVLLKVARQIIIQANVIGNFKDDAMLDLAQFLLKKYSNEFEIKTAVFNILSSLAQDEAIRIRMFQIGIIELIIDVIVQDLNHIDLCQVFINLITDLACTDLTRKEAVSHGGIEAISKIMDSLPTTESELHLNCCLALLTFLAEEDADTISHIRGQAVIKQLLNTLKLFKSNPHIVTSALNIIEVLPRDDEIINTIADCGGLLVLLSTARLHQINTDVFRPCCSLIGSIKTVLDKRRSSPSLRDNEADQFIEILHDKNALSCMKNTILHLMRQYATNEFNHRILATVQCIDEMARAIECHVGNKSFLDIGCQYFFLLSCGEHSRNTLTPKVIYLMRLALTELHDSHELQTCGMAAMPVIIEADNQTVNSIDDKTSWLSILSRNMRKYKSDHLIHTLAFLTLSTASIEGKESADIVSNLICESMVAAGNSSSQLLLWGCRALSNLFLKSLLTQSNDASILNIERSIVKAMMCCPDDGQLQLIGSQILIHITEINMSAISCDEEVVHHACKTALQNFPENEILHVEVNKLIIKLVCYSSNQKYISPMKNIDSSIDYFEEKKSKGLYNMINNNSDDFIN